MARSSNFVCFIRAAAAEQPDRLALSVPDYARLHDPASAERVTYGGLWRRITHHAATLSSHGVRAGDRVLVLAPLSIDLYAAVLAVMTVGAVAVLAPPGAGLRSFGRAMRTAQPRAIVGVPRLFRLRWGVPALWRVPIRVALTAPRSSHASSEPCAVDAGASALLTFTSGSTGGPKGVDRTHGTLSAQHLALRAAHPVPPDTVAMTCFPVAALHHLCCGHTTVLPALDLRDVAAVRPAWLLDQIRRHDVRVLTGPPPTLHALASYVNEHEPTDLPLRRIGIGGAPASRSLLEAAHRAFPEADTRILYGSTEAEPVAALDAAEALTANPDAPLGYPAGIVDAAADVRLIRLHDGTLQTCSGQRLDDLTVTDGAWGEIIVRGPHVVERYVEAPEAEARHKLRDEDGRVWHRMGDVARRDAAGRLWLGGRLGRLIPTPNGPEMPFPHEIRLERLPGVHRAAFHTHHGHVRLWLDGELSAATTAQARRLAQRYGARLVTGHRIPVDARHRWKVDYAALDRLACRVT